MRCWDWKPARMTTWRSPCGRDRCWRDCECTCVVRPRKSKLSRPIPVGSLVADAGRRSVNLHGAVVDLTTAEFDLLYLLAKHAWQPLSRKNIYLQIHGIKHDGVDRSIDLRISRLRKKRGDDPANPQRIKSVRGVGYMLSVEP